MKFKTQNPYHSFVEQVIKDTDKSGYNIENVLLSGYAYMQLFGRPLQRKRSYLFVECKTSSCVFYLDEIKRLTSAEIHKIDVNTTKNTFMKATNNADVIITRMDLVETVKKFADPNQKKIVSVGSANDVSLLLNILRPE
ncbi:hypothetical protein WMZ97_15315 [Lentibacillus sp. N15]|uniref:hypothetical protein n=1 Tax=Lentibacillus songyuanensis TaxID=3136161 RepID=UPI0031BAECF8